MAMALAAVFHLAIGLCALLALRLSPGLVDTSSLAMMFAGWVAVCLLVLLVSLVPMWRGQRGEWTPYVAIIGYGGFVAVVVVLMGFNAASWTAIAPLVVLLVPIYWDLSAGRCAFAFLLVCYGLAVLLQMTETVPFAPLMLQRSIDAQLTLGWQLASTILICSVLAYVFLIVHFSVSVRERQQERLERPAATSPSSSPTCPMSSARR
jgi:hypothetical protein